MHTVNPATAAILLALIHHTKNIPTSSLGWSSVARGLLIFVPEFIVSHRISLIWFNWRQAERIPELPTSPLHHSGSAMWGREQAGNSSVRL